MWVIEGQILLHKLLKGAYCKDKLKAALSLVAKQLQNTSNPLISGGFIRSDPGVPHPDIQFHFMPSQVIDHGRVAPKVEAYQVHVGPMRATSRGWLKLQSKDPRTHPLIEPKYLDTEQDR